jgi:hypothetical protein
MVKAVRLWGTEYKPSKWLAEPTDINVWSEESNAEVIKVIQGPSWKGVEHEDTYIHGEWTVELDNGCIFENPAQGRDYTRVSAAVASLGWLGQAYETQFWYDDFSSLHCCFVLVYSCAPSLCICFSLRHFNRPVLGNGMMISAVCIACLLLFYSCSSSLCTTSD